MPATITEQDLHNALPDVTSETRLADLDRPVDILRDPWGIPHIRAADEHDLFFAQGFATAQDRLWQMDADRQQALGQWARLIGTGGVNRDRLLRSTGLATAARADYETISPDAKTMVDAYTAGINAFIDTTRHLPIEYTILAEHPQRWASWHCLAVYKIRNTLLGTFEPKLLRTRLLAIIGPDKLAAMIRGYPKGHLLTVPPGATYEGPAPHDVGVLSEMASQLDWLDEPSPGSNAWALGGDRTASGRPLVAGDSHRTLDTPNVYYQTHLACPSFDVIGYSIPGMPGVMHFCHNEYVAWGMTYGGSDTQDLFIERFREGPQGREYAFEDHWRPATVRNEKLEIRGEPAVEFEVTTTHHGPVIAGDPTTGKALTISDPGLIDATPWTDAVRDAMRSQSVAEFQTAMRNWTDRVNNYAVADVHGTFGYLHAGKIPIRPEANGWCAVPGWTGEHEWHGYIPHEELPQALKPDKQYVVTCNQRVTAHDYPYYLALTSTAAYRARSITNRILELRGGATVDDMAAFLAERISDPARIFTNALLTITVKDQGSAEALQHLKAWDYRMDRDLIQPSIYAKTKAYVVRSLAQHLLGNMAGSLLDHGPGSLVHLRLIEVEMVEAIQINNCSWLPPGHDWNRLLASGLKQAVADLTKQLGPELSNWQWGRIHHTDPEHPLSRMLPNLAHRLNPPSMAVHGDGDTPLAGSYTLQDRCIATSLSVNRYIHDPSDWTRSRWIVPLGASGHPGSPHYADQAGMWADVQFIPQLWDWDQIGREAESEQRLTPLK